jgi:hypothetical protein
MASGGTAAGCSAVRLASPKIPGAEALRGFIPHQSIEGVEVSKVQSPEFGCGQE